ncbi:NAD-dependent epimerase/dehydratase family protein [Pseudomonas sp. JS3066]|uniref:NAD-dependent epimerase/dehydratase family protein n=1 Tax=Pseudomonas sp. JS3066 TaxID=3090665 RepID=UPI002E7B5752|nr:NAD-dependent epimerase/dehydratase family protein [Pseudomonas sp. JS3066]WVK95012.1 NAD-dependent epimerase/dehydratase family protein [Pseudomonas sp. JS3066]
MRILLTGSSGFVGASLRKEILLRSDWDAIFPCREIHGAMQEDPRFPFLGDLRFDTDWGTYLGDVDVVVHAAALAHAIGCDMQRRIDDFEAVNTHATLALARQAAEAGVKRFVFLSTVKVLGEYSIRNSPFRPDSVPNPVGPYAASKRRAEEGLLEISRETGLEIVIIRPVLVYGTGVGANFLRMIRWVSKGVALPLASVDNLRSFVALENLVDLVLTCVTHPAAANEIFLVSDGRDVSTPELLRKIGSELGCSARLFPVPKGLLRFGAGLTGNTAELERLCGTLQVDISKTKSLLGWSPVIEFDQALHRTVRHYLEHQSK